MKLLKNKKGMTMVNVMVAFALLLMILLMFSQAVNISLNLYRKAEDERHRAEEMYSEFYTNSVYTSTPTPDYPKELVSAFTFTDQRGDAFTISGDNAQLHQYQSGGETIYFFGFREKVSP